MTEPLGQILPESEFGKLLTKLAREAETIVEVGTWRGEGSTRCLANGLLRATQKFWTIEHDETRWKEAKARYDDPRIVFLQGRAIEFFREWPTPIDLLLLDGDDEQTDNEFDLIEPRCRCIALDDTHERKNRRQLKLLAENKWSCLGKNSKDRFGWAVFQRP